MKNRDQFIEDMQKRLKLLNFSTIESNINEVAFLKENRILGIFKIQVDEKHRSKAYSEFLYEYMIFLQYCFFLTIESEQVIKDYKSIDCFLNLFKYDKTYFPKNINISIFGISDMKLKDDEIQQFEFFTFNQKFFGNTPRNIHQKFLKIYTDFATKLDLLQLHH